MIVSVEPDGTDVLLIDPLEETTIECLQSDDPLQVYLSDEFKPDA